MTTTTGSKPYVVVIVAGKRRCARASYPSLAEAAPAGASYPSLAEAAAVAYRLRKHGFHTIVEAHL